MNKLNTIQFFNNLETYDVVIINYKRINNDYKIYGVAGVLDYKSTIKLCYKKIYTLWTDSVISSVCYFSPLYIP